MMSPRKASHTSAKNSRRTDTADRRPVSKGLRWWLIILSSFAVGVSAIGIVVYMTPMDDAQYGLNEDSPVGSVSGGVSVGSSAIVDEAVELPSTPVPIDPADLQSELGALASELTAKLPDSLPAYHISGMIYTELHQTAKAVEVWEKCVAMKPVEAGPYVGLAIAEMERGNDAHAVEVLKAAREENITSPELTLQLSIALSRIGELKQAEEVSLEGTAAFPDSGENWLQLGQVQLQSGKFAEAESSVRIALAKNANPEQAWFALANALVRQKKNAEAEAARERVAKIKAGSTPEAGQRDFQKEYDTALIGIAVKCMRGAGELFVDRQRPDRGEALLHRANELDPSDMETLMALSRTYRKQNRFGSALLAQQRLLELQPNNIINYVNLASVALLSGKQELAEKTLLQASELFPAASLPCMELARLYGAVGNLADARRFAELAILREPQVESYLMLIELCQRAGDRLAARAAYEDALLFSPSDPRLQAIGVRSASQLPQ